MDAQLAERKFAENDTARARRMRVCAFFVLATRKMVIVLAESVEKDKQKLL